MPGPTFIQRFRCLQYEKRALYFIEITRVVWIFDQTAMQQNTSIALRFLCTILKNRETFYSGSQIRGALFSFIFHSRGFPNKNLQNMQNKKKKHKTLVFHGTLVSANVVVVDRLEP